MSEPSGVGSATQVADQPRPDDLGGGPGVGRNPFTCLPDAELVVHLRWMAERERYVDQFTFYFLNHAANRIERLQPPF